MRNVSDRLRHVSQLTSILFTLIVEAIRYLGFCLRPSPALAAENLFLRKQLALYDERQTKPARAANATRLAMVWLSYYFDWRPVLRIVTPGGAAPYVTWARHSRTPMRFARASTGASSPDYNGSTCGGSICLGRLPWYK